MSRWWKTDHDGRFNLLGLPGPGIWSFLLLLYPHGQGLKQLKNIPNDQQFYFLGTMKSPSDGLTAVKEVNFTENDLKPNVDFQLDAGKTVALAFVDPHGKPLASVQAIGYGRSARMERCQVSDSTGQIMDLAGRKAARAAQPRIAESLRDDRRA